MASASPPAVQSWHEPTRLQLVPKIEETTLWETLQKHWGGALWGDPSNPPHQQQRRPDRNTRLAQMLDCCDKAQWRLYRRPVNVFCKINSFLKRKHTVCRTFEMTHVVAGYGLPLMIMHMSVYCCLGLHLSYHMRRQQSQENLHCFCWGLHHPRYSQTG